MKASFSYFQLQFKQPAGTSRGVYTTRPVWYLFLEENNSCGVGECAPLAGLSKETPEEVEKLLKKICSEPQKYLDNPQLLEAIPSVRFALETAKYDLLGGGKQILFPSRFTEGESGIPINGLIWMGEAHKMREQIDLKLEQKSNCIKLKIGHLNFEEEIGLLEMIRSSYPSEKMILRVDANGAYRTEEVAGILERLAKLNIHSIEQPIKAGNWNEMAEVCRYSPVPVALDEELIGINTREEKELLLDTIKPAYLVLKPSLHGGFSGCDEWIELAEQRTIGWWITSYLESNIGLNAIAQWTAIKSIRMHQGLGTGKLFVNNVDSPLYIEGEQLRFDPVMKFNLNKFIKRY